MNPFLEKFARENFNTPGKALDLGAGGFADVNGLKQLGWEAIGVDLNTGVNLEEPFLSDAAPFDLVCSNYLLHKLKNRTQLIRTAYDNLKPDGWFFLHVFDVSDTQSSSDLTVEKIGCLLSNSGFEKIAVDTIDRYDDEASHSHWHKVLQATAQKPVISF